MFRLNLHQPASCVRRLLIAASLLLETLREMVSMQHIAELFLFL